MKQASLSDYFSSDFAAVERVGSRSSAAAISSSPAPNTATDTTTSLCATGPWTWTQQLRRDTTSRKKATPRSTSFSPPTRTAATAATKQLNGNDESGSRSWYQHLCNQLETRKFKDSVLRVNSIVYAPFPGEKPTEEGTSKLLCFLVWFAFWCYI